MRRTPAQARILRFATYEVDRDSGELYKSGVRQKLTGQPFEVLCLLLERPNQIVTREEFHERIWSKDTFVDYDLALRKAITRLRESLGDSAENPRFIETIPRKGYRFIAAVQSNGQVDAGKITSAAFEQVAHSENSADVKQTILTSAIAIPVRDEVESERGANLPPSSGEVPSQSGKIVGRSRWRWISAALILVAVWGMFPWFSRRLPPPRVLKVTQITREKFDLTNVLSDGSRLYITESSGSSQYLVQTGVAGGETSVIPTPFSNIAISDISPDHSQLLVTDVVGTENDYPVWILPLAAGTPRRLGNVFAHWILWETGWAVWSPDGRQIAFAKDSKIYMTNVQGADVRELVTLSGPATEICFSPDGTRLRFTVWSPQHDSPSIWEANSDGTNLHRLLPYWHGALSEIAGAWSPDGRYYFFSGCDEQCTIWAIRDATGWFQKRALPPFQLTTSPMFFNGVNPNGRTLLGSAWSTRLELVRYDTSSHQFVSFLGGMEVGDLDFSKDGKWIAYVSVPDGTLWRSRVDGSERLQLTSEPFSAQMPRWSPDGTRIAYVDKRAGRRWKIFLVPAQGGTPHELLSENLNQLDPSWSPDGNQLVFGRVPWTGEEISIQILDLNSKQVSIVPGSQNLFAPRWSPDGQHLAAVSVGNKKLLFFDFKTKKWTDWIDEPGTVCSPAWSRDGKYIYYNNTSTKNPAYRRVKVGHTRSEFLIDLKGLNLDTGMLGPWTGIAPDGSALFERSLSTSDTYSLSVELP